ncbi:MAG TPA: lipoprotein-releasing system transmembrane subunit, LolC/LolE family, partial [Gammaproteobacteria bacterium]|nr:lipoprotein-releasing system transmembrane subunit, LolC/LolE family [Gammaproteobacteria bacterium]
MSVEFSISNQYLRSNRKKGFVSFISGVSMVGLILSVTTLITVLSVMNGFHKELRDRVLSAISHSTISEYSGTLTDWQTLRLSINQNPHVLESSPYIERYGLLSINGRSQGVSVRGVDPRLEKNTSILLDNIKSGNADLTGANILIGSGLALQLGVNVGDKITLLTPEISSSIIGIQPRFKRFTLSGIFDAGINEYDNNLAFIHLNQAQKLYNMKGLVSGVRLKVDDLFEARRITNQVVKKLGNDRYY